MKIIEFNQFGDPAKVLGVKQMADRPLSAGEVRVRVLAVPIHPANLLQIAGQYGVGPELPNIPSCEGVGEIVELGDGVTHLNLGQNVLLLGVGGTWRDTLIAPASALIPVPPGDVEQLSMLAVNPLTAHLMLTDFVDLKDGDWIIQSAANSAVGEMVIQLAAQRGIKTINVVRREDVIPGLKSIGATEVLLDGDDLTDRVRSVTSGADIRLAFDAVGGQTFDRLIGTLAYGGSIVSYGNLTSKAPEMNTGALIRNDLRVRGFWLAKWFETASANDKQAALGSLISLITSGHIRTKVDSRYPLDEISNAVTRAAESNRDGKVLLTPNSAFHASED